MVLYAGATLVGWLGLVWVRGLGLTEALGYSGCLDLVLIHAFKVEEECKPWGSPIPQTWRESSSSSPTIWCSSRADLLCPSWSFKPRLFPVPHGRQICPRSLYLGTICLHCSSQCWGGGSLCYCFLSFLLFSVWSIF